MTKRCGTAALVGRPNAGKSTFLNYALGEKVSIVSDKPQTTRNRILGVYHRDNLQIGFLDLPGVHKPKHKMNRNMMRDVRMGLEDADVLLHFVDVTVPSGSGDRFVHEFIADKDLPIILVLNKMDLINKQKAIAVIDWFYKEFSPQEIIPISAKTGVNVDRLLEVLGGYLPAGNFIFEDDQLTNQPLRFMAQEYIREKLLFHLRDEIPHAVAVTVEDFSYVEEEDSFLIGGYIWVERVSQRRIVLGAGGKMISKVTTSARRDLRKLLGKPVFLELQVKVQKKWREDKAFLQDLDLPH